MGVFLDSCALLRFIASLSCKHATQQRASGTSSLQGGFKWCWITKHTCFIVLWQASTCSRHRDPGTPTLYTSQWPSTGVGAVTFPWEEIWVNWASHNRDDRSDRRRNHVCEVWLIVRLTKFPLVRELVTLGENKWSGVSFYFLHVIVGVAVTKQSGSARWHTSEAALPIHNILFTPATVDLGLVNLVEHQWSACRLFLLLKV